MAEYQKYINALRKCAKEHNNDITSTGHIIVSDLCRDIANLLESLEQEPKMRRWIPVSERPKESGKYFVTFGGTHLTGVAFYTTLTGVAFYTTEEDARRTFEEPEEYIGWNSNNVIAWMPLHEPYKVESEDKE